MNALTLLGISTASLFNQIPGNAIWVSGAVHSPGVFSYKPGMRFMDAISLTRGELPRVTDVRQIKIWRRTPNSKQNFETIRVDLVRYIKTNDPSLNPELMPGDWIVVPKRERPTFADIRAALGRGKYGLVPP